MITIKLIKLMSRMYKNLFVGIFRVFGALLK